MREAIEPTKAPTAGPPREGLGEERQEAGGDGTDALAQLDDDKVEQLDGKGKFLRQWKHLMIKNIRIARRNPTPVICFTLSVRRGTRRG